VARIENLDFLAPRLAGAGARPGGEPTMSERVFSSHEVGALLQANPSTVIRWIDSGQLKAYRTPGGHRRVRERDLVAFLRAFGMPIPSELGGGENRRILLVDADARLLRALRRGLAKVLPGCEVETCENWIEALLRIGASPPDVVVIDLALPGLDGLEVCRTIKAHPQTAGVAVVALSSQGDRDMEEKARDAGAVTLLAKPVTASQLGQVLNR
jgi:excisionase family DNA binding protein